MNAFFPKNATIAISALILNKKYPKEEYFKRFAEIKKELQSQNMWGKMWIPTTYPYEDTSAALYYPK